MKVIGRVIGTIVAAFLYWLVYYITLPTLSLAYLDGFIYIGIGIIIIIALIVWWLLLSKEFEKSLYAIPITGIALFIILVGGAIAGSSLFNSGSMYNQIGIIDKEKLSFKDDVVEIDTSQIPIVDIQLADKLADKTLGDEIALGSKVEVGKFTNKQQVNGKLVYVAPLDHRSFWKWNANKSGTPGYVVVSATNMNDVQLVKEINGKELKIKYSESAYFSDNLKRNIRNKGFRNVGLTEFSFELDDDGNPFWVVTTYKNTTLWGNGEATGVVICDPQTGECEWYSVKDAPEWVDIIQPEEFVKKQIENYGKYVHGVFNFSETDELSMTEHMTTVYNDGDCYYYTGMSSVGEDKATVGFIMVNTRDKSVKFYKMTGATEDSAMKSAEGAVQNMGYYATEPIPLNFAGMPTYFCTLKDNEGLVKKYALLNIEHYSNVVVGDSIAEAKRSYINAMNNVGVKVDFGDGEVYGYTKEGIVSRIGSNIENGETYYYFILDNDTTKLYLASYTVSEELPITREGDNVKVSYLDDANGSINIASFDNLDFSQTISDKQEEYNEEKEEKNLVNNPDNNVINVEPEKDQATWDSLTDEEKAKLLENLEE